MMQLRITGVQGPETVARILKWSLEGWRIAKESLESRDSAGRRIRSNFNPANMGRIFLFRKHPHTLEK